MAQPAKKPILQPVPPINLKAGASIAECVVEALGDGGDVAADVVAASEAWQNGKSTPTVWATLYRWAYVTLEGSHVRILSGLW